MIYGVNSKIPSNIKLTNGYCLHDWVMRKSCFPSFWGRTLVGEYPITLEEIEFLKSKNCKVAFVIRNLDELSISGIDGTNEAINAIAAAKKINVPPNKGIAIFAEIPSDFSVNHNWMITFARALSANGYIPGFIGNTDSSLNFNFDRQCSHYVQATMEDEFFNALYWATEPKYQYEPEIWAPYAPSELLPKDINIWSYGTIKFHSICVDKSYISDCSMMNYFM